MAGINYTQLFKEADVQGKIAGKQRVELLKALEGGV